MKIFKQWLCDKYFIIMESIKINDKEEIFNVKWYKKYSSPPTVLELNTGKKKFSTEEILSGKWRETPHEIKKQFVNDIGKMGEYLAKRNKKQLAEIPNVINYDKNSGVLQLKLKYK